MPREERSYFDLAASLSYGRDTAVNNTPDLKSNTLGIQGHIGIGSVGRRYSRSFTHDATLVEFPSSNIERQQYHWTTVNLTGMSSRRTAWGLNAANAYGADAARAGSSVSLASVNSPIDNSGVQTGLITGSTLRQYVTFLVDHTTSEVSAISFGASAGFHNFLGAAPSTRQYEINAAYREFWSPRLLVGVRGDAVQQNFGAGTCVTAALDGLSTYQMTTAIRIDGSGGPVFGSAQCTGNYQYEFIVSAQSARGNRAYIGTSRKRGNGSVAGSLWETSVYGGAQMGNPRRFTATLSGGYSSYHGGALTDTSADINGYFVSAEYRRPLSEWAEWSFTARHFQRTGSSIDLTRTVFFVTFTWLKQHGGPRVR
ncbi:hypothetical protein [Terriglobus albidus]|uniref:hypothetical protein n=1 Tax=Terriglobus albidus TaxID=1592106 RepID=UPI0021DFD495|nr:hypothetical protein [Terriglobus albidus]